MTQVEDAVVYYTVGYHVELCYSDQGVEEVLSIGGHHDIEKRHMDYYLQSINYSPKELERCRPIWTYLILLIKQTYMTRLTAKLPVVNILRADCMVPPWEVKS